jgi:hypothetical protein
MMRSERRERSALLVAVALAVAAACGPDTAGGGGTAEGTTSATTEGTSAGSGTDASTGDLCSGVHEGELRIDETTDLATVAGITMVNGDLSITGVASTDLGFLACLEEVNGDMDIWENPSLETLGGATRLVAIRSGFAVGGGNGSLRILSNPMLTTLAGLDNLEGIDSGMLLSGNASLASIGLERLERIELGWTIGGCESASSREPALGTGNNAMLTAFDGLDSLRYVGGLSIHGQEHLTSLSRLRELAEGGTEFGSLLEVGVNPELPESEITAFVSAAGIATVEACQNKDDTELCYCPPD